MTETEIQRIDNINNIIKKEEYLFERKLQIQSKINTKNLVRFVICQQNNEILEINLKLYFTFTKATKSKIESTNTLEYKDKNQFLLELNFEPVIYFFKESSKSDNKLLVSDDYLINLLSEYSKINKNDITVVGKKYNNQTNKYNYSFLFDLTDNGIKDENELKENISDWTYLINDLKIGL
jgi:hypothetical protein